MKTTHMPFEKLLTEVIRRVHAPSQSTETNSSLAVNLPVEDYGIVEKKDGSDTEQALSVKPLQVLQPIVDSHRAVASIPSEDYKTGKITQLLQIEPDNLKSPETEVGSEWSSISKIRARADGVPAASGLSDMFPENKLLGLYKSIDN
ncbi:hypothetical protein NC652_004337 [Populus alba x Populus x berolinensis]|nr:hypothetical protein NC652_004337 [Populus alba x Populus x berolinensis]